MRIGIMLLTIALIGTTVSAQQRPSKRRIQELKKANPKMNIDLSTQPPGEPVDKLTVPELLLQRKDLAGKVIELEFDRATGLKQTSHGYTAKLFYDDVRDASGVMILIPEEGFDMFEVYSKNDARYRRRETVLVEILPANAVRAVGKRYSKNKPEGERYVW